MLESIFFKDTGDADAFDLLSTHWESRYNPFQGLQLSRSVGVESLLFCTNIKSAKGPSSQSYGFSSSHVWMWELDYKESWALKNWCFWPVVLGKTFESPLDCKEIQPVHPKGNQSWIFIGRTDAEAEALILWPPDVNSWLTEKDSDAGKEGGRRGWDGWMVSPTQWTWIWVNSGSWWWTERPGVLWFMGLQRGGHDWVTELNWMLLGWCKHNYGFGLWILNH